MLKLNASYSKKVPADGEYTSQSYHASIEVELPDGLSSEQLNSKIHETFEMVRNSVEAELHGNTVNHQGGNGAVNTVNDVHPKSWTQLKGCIFYGKKCKNGVQL